MTNHEEFDGLLHQALGEYRDAEPLAGMESRILARLDRRHSRRSPFVLRFAFALATAVVVALVIWLGIARRPPQTFAPADSAIVRPVGKAPVPSPAPSTADATSGTAALRKPAVYSVLAAPSPKIAAHTMPGVFPSPAPLTPAELSFVAALNHNPDALPVSSETDQAITIAEIEIKPLALGSVSSSEHPGETQ